MIIAINIYGLTDNVFRSQEAQVTVRTIYNA